MNSTNKKQELFMRLYTPVEGNLSAFCFAKTHNRDEAAELVSETILAAYENIENLKSETAFLSFLFSIASNIIKAKYRKSQRFVVSDPEVFDLMYSNTTQPDLLTDIKILYEALDKLPVIQKEAIYLFDIMGISQKEIAVIQNTTALNIKLRIFRGKKKLAEILKSNSDSIQTDKKQIKVFEDVEDYENE